MSQPKIKIFCVDTLTLNFLYIVFFLQNKSIKLSGKSGMPLNVLPSRGPTKKQLEKELHDEFTLPSIAPTRPVDRKETSEERRLRKQAIKQDRRVRCGFKNDKRSLI